ncbi:MAG TPA: lamin tail domain-containing protein, partial [Anseongella sp.]|nr:lamin tail domain-containing protein [Anseongella sp.]
MKTFCLILLSGLYLFQAAAQLNEHFTDGNFTHSPSWEGDTAAWRVDGQLRLNTRDTSVSQSVYLSTSAPNSKNAKWEFLLQMNFNPSPANRLKIYLSSDRPGLKGPLEGYYLQVGESGADDGYDLYRQDSLTSTRILEGPAVIRVSPDTLRVRLSIRRDEWGNWEIYADGSGGRQFALYGKVRDAVHPPGEHFGLLAEYTASRSAGFFFDDLGISSWIPDPPFIPGPGALIITEVLADPAPSAGLPGTEFFELYNTTGTIIRLVGWTWQDAHGAAGFENDSIAPGGYLIVCPREDTAAFSGYGPAAGIHPFPSLNNTGDRLKLISPYGQLIDSLDYSDAWYRDAEK